MNTKIWITIILIGLFSLHAFPQEQISIGKEPAAAKEEKPKMKTLFGSDKGKIDHGGYGAFTMGYTQIDGQDALLMGGRAGWIIDHHFTIGFAGYGFFNDLEGDYHYMPTPDHYALGGGYGGLFLEPIIAPNSPVHVSIPILIGAGGATVIEDYNHYNYDPYYHNYTTTPYFLFEPGIDLELNIVKFFRIGLNTSYRYTSDLHLDYVSYDGLTHFTVPEDALRGFNYSMTLKFGWF